MSRDIAYWLSDAGFDEALKASHFTNALCLYQDGTVGFVNRGLSKPPNLLLDANAAGYGIVLVTNGSPDYHTFRTRDEVKAIYTGFLADFSEP